MKQDSRSHDLIFGGPPLAAERSAVLRLLPGELSLTGPPAGVGITRRPARFLRAGEVLETCTGGIGTIRDRFVAAGG